MIGIKTLITFIKKSICIYIHIDFFINGLGSETNNHTDRAVECVAIAIRELCDMRDSDDTRVFSGSELKFMIDMLCTM